MSVLSALGLGPAGAQQHENTEGKRVAVLKISGMACGACAATVEKEVKKLDGVREAKVSQRKGIAEITCDPTKVSPEALVKAINEKTSFRAEVVPKPKN